MHLQPRKGCFEVRAADGTSTYVSLLVRANPTCPLRFTPPGSHSLLTQGCIAVLCSGERSYVLLQDMPRPFTKLKALDLDELATQIVEGNKS